MKVRKIKTINEAMKILRNGGSLYVESVESFDKIGTPFKTNTEFKNCEYYYYHIVNDDIAGLKCDIANACLYSIKQIYKELQFGTFMIGRSFVSLPKNFNRNDINAVKNFLLNECKLFEYIKNMLTRDQFFNKTTNLSDDLINKYIEAQIMSIFNNCKLKETNYYDDDYDGDYDLKNPRPYMDIVWNN